MWLYNIVRVVCACFGDLISVIIRLVLAFGESRTCSTGGGTYWYQEANGSRLLNAAKCFLMAIFQKQQFSFKSLAIQQDKVLFRWQGPLQDTSGFYIEYN